MTPLESCGLSILASTYVLFSFFLRIYLDPLMTCRLELKQPSAQLLVRQALRAAKGSRATLHSLRFPLMLLHISLASLGAHRLPL